jgi:hypothetical protein
LLFPLAVFRTGTKFVVSHNSPIRQARQILSGRWSTTLAIVCCFIAGPLRSQGPFAGQYRRGCPRLCCARTVRRCP